MASIAPYWQSPLVALYLGDAAMVLQQMPAESVDLCVTSPPFWGLRNYGVAGQIGLEPTPELWLEHILAVFQEVRRVLKPWGCAFVEIGDSYAGSGSPGGDFRDGKGGDEYLRPYNHKGSGLKPLDLVGIPFRLALALQQPYQEFTIRNLADRAWLAGIIDGEGTIGIHHFERTDRGHPYENFQPFIAVGSSDLCLVDHCVAITGMGGSRQRTEAGYEDNRKIVSRRAHYEWRLEGHDAIKVLEDVYPHLILKERQARIAYALSRCNGPHPRQGRPVPEEIIEERRALWQLCKACNQRREVDVNLPKVPQHIEPGWWLRSVIIWDKPAPMPESLAGWRWAKCRMKIKAQPGPRSPDPTESGGYLKLATGHSRPNGSGGSGLADSPIGRAEWADCPGCPKCSPNNGLVLRKGSWRPTEAHSYILMLAKGVPYFANGEAVREAAEYGYRDGGMRSLGWLNGNPLAGGTDYEKVTVSGARPQTGRNLRSIWRIGPEPSSLPHFATYPVALPEKCILAGTSEWGNCPRCGMPWVPIVKRIIPDFPIANRAEPYSHGGANSCLNVSNSQNYQPEITILGWRASCSCALSERVAPVVLDPFVGTGTTCVAAQRLGRKSIGIDLNAKYLDMAAKRLEGVSLPLVAQEGKETSRA